MEYFTKEWQGTYTGSFAAAYDKTWSGPRTYDSDYAGASASYTKAFSGKNYEKEYVGQYEKKYEGQYTAHWTEQ